MWITASSPNETPAAIDHRITIKSSDEPDEVTTDTPLVPVSRNPVVVIDPPLRGDDWMAVNGPSNSSSHRWAVLLLDGSAFVAQRSAIDWARVFPDDEISYGDPLVNRNYRSYCEPVYAVADGTITEVKDGFPRTLPEQTPEPLQ